MNPHAGGQDRREFLGTMAGAGALLGLDAPVASAGAVGKPGTPNPFHYDLSRFQRTEPALITHEVADCWPGSRPGARYITTGPDDQVYLCAGNFLTAFSPAGKPGLELALPDKVYCAAVGAEGTVYAGTRSAVHVYDPSGRPRGVWPSANPKSWFTGMAVGGREVFVADSAQRIVLRFDRDGRLIGRIGEKNPEKHAPGLAVPSPYLAVILHPDGRLRVNNTGRHQVDAYGFDGEFLGAWGRTSFSIAGFCGCCNPVGIAALPDGRIITAEKGLPRVKVYTAAGGFESVVAGVESFPENAATGAKAPEGVHNGLGVAVDSQARVCILDFTTGEVRVMRRRALA